MRRAAASAVTPPFVLRAARAARRRARGRREREGARRLYLRDRSEAALRSYEQRIERYWTAHYGRPVDTSGHLVFTAVTGEEDVRFIPHLIWRNEILPLFNDLSMRLAFIDKNLAEVFLDGTPMPLTIVRRMRGRYYDSRYRQVRRDEVMACIDAHRARADRLIIKPSRTDNGVRIEELVLVPGSVTLGGFAQSLDQLEHYFGPDFLVQEKIVQHPVLAAPHPASVNTIRLVTFRWEAEVRLLGAAARFGNDGRINDNATTGGLIGGIDESGRLASAVDAEGRSMSRHPTTGVEFADVVIPNWERFPPFVFHLHSRLPHFDLVSWDIAVSEAGDPIFLEMNFLGASYKYQWAFGRPLFGELTEDVLHAVRAARDGTRR